MKLQALFKHFSDESLIPQTALLFSDHNSWLGASALANVFSPDFLKGRYFFAAEIEAESHQVHEFQPLEQGTATLSGFSSYFQNFLFFFL